MSEHYIMYTITVLRLTPDIFLLYVAGLILVMRAMTWLLQGVWSDLVKKVAVYCWIAYVVSQPDNGRTLH